MNGWRDHFSRSAAALLWVEAAGAAELSRLLLACFARSRAARINVRTVEHVLEARAAAGSAS